jgi:uncharacterized membrane protein YebE (DUF533 family)
MFHDLSDRKYLTENITNFAMVFAEERLMRMIAEALDDGNVDDEEQKQIEEAELQVNFSDR